MIRLCALAFAAASIIAQYLIWFHAPVEQSMGVVQKIFYTHMPLAWWSTVSFFVNFVASILYLVKRRDAYSRLAGAAAELGVLFSGLALITGMCWARPIWNVWWTWDPRLTTTLVLWVYYAGVLALRGSVDEPETRARYTAVLSIIGFINVPLVFMAIRWWRTIHPVILDARGMHLEPAMLVALVAALVAFTLLYATLCLAQVRAAYLRQRVEALQGQMEDRLEKRMARRPGQGAA